VTPPYHPASLRVSIRCVFRFVAYFNSLRVSIRCQHTTLLGAISARGSD
jgi:hypothetical protein